MTLGVTPGMNPGWTGVEEFDMTLEQYAAAMQEQVSQQQDEMRRESGLEVEVLAEGRSLVYRYRYIIDVGDFANAKAAQKEALDALADTFMQDLMSVQIMVPKTESLIVEYWTMDGQLLAMREFKNTGI